MPKGLVACLAQGTWQCAAWLYTAKSTRKKGHTLLAHSVNPAKAWELVTKDTGTRCLAKGTSDVQEGWLGIARADALEGNPKERVTRTAGTAGLPGGAQAKPNTQATLSYTDSQGWEPRPPPNLVTSINHAQHHHACCGQAAKQGKLLP